MPTSEKDRERFEDLAERLEAALRSKQVRFGDVMRILRLPHHNYIRYATVTGRLRIRWDGARQPNLWTVAAPKTSYRAARLELARRYLHVFGTGTPASFGDWAGVRPASSDAAFADLERSLTPVRTPVGDAWILTSDEAALRAKPTPTDAARLLPSGDTYFLLQGADRGLLVPSAKQRAALWTTRVWPGAVLVHAEVVGVWRRGGALVSIDAWRRLTPSEREAVETEALSLPLPDVAGRMRVKWSGG